MARKSQHTFSKRQREQKKAEKAAQKRARRAAPKDPPTAEDSPAPLSEATEDDAPIGGDGIPAAD